ncbi:elongation of very long chain fatty acids protein 7-like isoform X1 [Bicyclus anynana]|uniref:Elongation of very long chain fatty acids protein n=1 Tax=Bicyclus anynana TaxID=110368 RepID=A0ABM3LH40_BICAN|nr:elongation of very long chain fatty acids protein 7-like isoform X1 [Bicyclus anynana]
MGELLLEFNETIQQWNTKQQKMEVQDWFLIRSPYPVPVILISYWLFVLKLGPLYMKSKQPFHVTKCLTAYNIFQVLFSLYTTTLAVDFLLTYSLFPSICPGDPIELRVVLTKGSYTYLIAKISELVDTVFFVLKKNYHQITFLHVYHHSINIFVTWIAIKIDSVNPSGAFLAAANGIVHIIMYTYYGLSTFPSMTKHLWWKKYITTLQLIQFGVIMLHHFVSYKIARCEELNIVFLAVIFHLFLFIYLFLDFYIKTYKKNKNLKSDTTSKTKIVNKDNKKHK